MKNTIRIGIFSNLVTSTYSKSSTKILQKVGKLLGYLLDLIQLTYITVFDQLQSTEIENHCRHHLFLLRLYL